MNKIRFFYPAKLLHIVVSFGVFLGLWQLIVSIGNFNQALLPTPTVALAALWELIIDGTLISHIGASMYRFALGYLSAVIVAIPLGLLFGRFKTLFLYVNPVIQLLRPVSPLAWLPFIVLWFGIGDLPAAIIIFIATFFPVLLATVSAVNHIDPVYYKVAANFEIKGLPLIYKVVLPASFPQIAAGLRLALGAAWVFLVCGEMAGPQSGLGYLIVDARNNLRADILAADILVIGFIGLMLDSSLRFIEKSILKSWGHA